MSIHADIAAALDAANVADGAVFPDAADEGVDPPFVVYRRASYDPLMLLSGPSGEANSVFVFECWGMKTETQTAKASALALAAQVKAAIEGASSLATRFLLPHSGEEFEPELLQIMEPVQYSFWHVDD